MSVVLMIIVSMCLTTLITIIPLMYSGTLGAIGAGRGRKNIEMKSVKSVAPPKEKTEFDCVVYGQRLFEQKLVDAGIQDNIETICEDKECPGCYPNRPGNGISRVPTPAPDRVRRTADLAKIDRVKREARESFEKSRYLKRVAIVSGRVVPRPGNVPNWATGVLVMDRGIVWTWTLDGSPNGKPMALRQHMSAQVFDLFPLASPAKPTREIGSDHMKSLRRQVDDHRKVMEGLKADLNKIQAQSRGYRSTGPR